MEFKFHTCCMENLQSSKRGNFEINDIIDKMF